MLLKNKNIILTGAGRGIGREIAKKLSSEGANLVLIARTESELIETLEILNSKNNSTFYIPLDISNEEKVIKSFGEILKRVKTVDCLINNAGVQPPIGPFNKINLSEWKQNININLFGTVNCTYAVMNKMIEGKKGKIINMAGGGSTSPRPNFSAYSVSKTAIVRFTETIARELKEFNIDVNAVSPGAINTGMNEEVIKANENAGDEYYEALNRKQEGGNNPAHAAELIYYLCSDLSDGITGKLISAQWDPWNDKCFRELLRTDKDIATLRRIDNKTYFNKS
jgi:NAD(P)-dependent dehydrogenase (short-subunit alcohol dehydrogenase family)